MSVLAPKLTALDRAVLDGLPGRGEPGKRMADTFARARRRCWCWPAGSCSGCVSDRVRREAAYVEHCEVLRGLAATGFATCRGGWWRKA